MNFYTLRLKRFTDKYVSKQNPSYAIKSDQMIEYYLKKGHFKTQFDALQTDAQWFKSPEYAKIWTSESAVKKFISRASNDGCLFWNNDIPSLVLSFSEFEIVVNGNEVLPVPTRIFKNVG